MKAYKIEILIIDHDSVGEEEIKTVIENTKYPNWCIDPHVMAVKSIDIEWSDDHPLNLTSQMQSAYNELFGE